MSLGSPHRILLPALILAAFLARPGTASPSLEWRLELGPTAGLDSLLRGVETEASLGLAWQGWGASLAAALAWDATLGSGRGLVGVNLNFGPDLALELGWEYALGEASFMEAESGAQVKLESSGLISRLGLSTRLADFPTLGGGRLGLRGRLSWSSYRLLSVEGLPSSISAADLIKTLAGREGFSAGFRASLMLTWSGPR